MVKTASTMLTLGTVAPDFSLGDTKGETVSLSDFADSKGLVVAFICNHCPFVKHIAETLASLSSEYQAKGISWVGISSNDAEVYPDDSLEAMKAEVELRGYTFPYLYDETQEIAKAYRAACTPDFFLFDHKQRLAYRGQLDSSRPETEIPVTGEDLRKAMDAVLAGQPVPEPQIPSLGCNIKWKVGAEPDYFNPQGVNG